jgi:glycosyltransferase involved in cell wall biosynthesis
MMIVKDEADRYLRPCFDNLLTFCDEIRVLDDGSTDDFREIGWYDDERVVIQRSSAPTFFENEGLARQALLDWTMLGEPTHIVAVDADELIGDGLALRREMEAKTGNTGVWKLRMEEVWKASVDGLLIRWDGMWSPRPIGIAFEVPEMRRDRQVARHWKIRPQNASGRTPIWITQASNRTTTDDVTAIFHFGWSCEADREARYARYANAGGFNHDDKHIKSIMYGDDRVELRRVKWPAALDRETLLARINRADS